MKTAILISGAFNPLTNAHLEMGKRVQQLYPDADIWYIPSNDNYISGKTGTSFLVGEERLFLLHKVLLSSAETENFRLSPIEINQTVDGYTYNTIQYFKQFHKYEDVLLCIGTDKFQGLSNWKHSEKLISENTILVFDREGCSLQNYLSYPLVAKYPDHFIQVPMPETFHQISSTKVRKAFYEDNLEEIEDMVPSQVYEFLQEYNSYTKELRL